jgi:rubrerythrin
MSVKTLEEQNKERKAIWQCDWCGYENDSRESTCKKCLGVRKSA